MTHSEVHTPTQPDSIYSPYPELHVRELTVVDGSMTVVLDGQIRFQAVQGMQDFLSVQQTAHVPRQLILDFNRVSFVDSQGLALLITLFKYCMAHNCQLIIRGASPQICILLKLTRLDQFIDLL